MPSPEHGPSGPAEQPRRHEAEPVPYHRTARFEHEQVAGSVYAAVQEAFFTGPANDLSAYRFLLDQVSHVTVLVHHHPQNWTSNCRRCLLSASLPRSRGACSSHSRSAGDG